MDQAQRMFVIEEEKTHLFGGMTDCSKDGRKVQLELGVQEVLRGTGETVRLEGRTWRIMGGRDPTHILVQ